MINYTAEYIAAAFTAIYHDKALPFHYIGRIFITYGFGIRKKGRSGCDVSCIVIGHKSGTKVETNGNQIRIVILFSSKSDFFAAAGIGAVGLGTLAEKVGYLSG